CPAPLDAARPDETRGPREDRAGPDGARAARQVDVVLAHPDPARAPRVHRAAAEVRGVCGESAVPELSGMISLPPVDRAQLVATRRDLHEHPELGFEERRTSALVAERLERLGYAVQTGVAQTGVVALRDGGGGGGGGGGARRCVLIRADMDGLPVDEAN